MGWCEILSVPQNGTQFKTNSTFLGLPIQHFQTAVEGRKLKLQSKTVAKSRGTATLPSSHHEEFKSLRG